MVESAGPLEKWRDCFHSSYITFVYIHIITVYLKTVGYSCVLCTVEPQLTGLHLSGLSVNRTTKMTAPLE